MLYMSSSCDRDTLTSSFRKGFINCLRKPEITIHQLRGMASTLRMHTCTAKIVSWENQSRLEKLCRFSSFKKPALFKCILDDFQFSFVLCLTNFSERALWLVWMKLCKHGYVVESFHTAWARASSRAAAEVYINFGILPNFLSWLCIRLCKYACHFLLL